MTRALFIAPISVCGAPDNGGAQRTLLLFNALIDCYETDVMIVGTGVAAMHKAPFARAATIYEGLHKAPCEIGAWRYLTAPLPCAFADKLASVFIPRRDMYQPDDKMASSLELVDLSAYELIVGRLLRPIARTGLLSGRAAAPVIVDIDDRDDRVFESRKTEKCSNPALDFLNEWHASQMRKIMADLLPNARHLWLVSDEDKEGLRHPSISVVANIPYSPPQDIAAPRPDASVLLFVGSAIHGPNLRGVSRFLKACWPRIKAGAPGATFRIVGGGWDVLPATLAAQPGVDIAGFVDDITEEYAGALCALSPIYDGGGTKIKVVEAMAHGRPVIVDRHSARGISDGGVGDGVVIATDDDAMVEACIRMLHDPASAAPLGEAARARAMSHFSHESFKERVIADCEAALGRQGLEETDVQ